MPSDRAVREWRMMDTTNLVVLRGSLSSSAVVKTLESGSVLVNLEVTTRDSDEAARTVPVSVFDPVRVDDLASLERGDEVVVVGSVNRRFFRTATGTASRTEVVAHKVVPAGQKSRVRSLVASAVKLLES